MNVSVGQNRIPQTIDRQWPVPTPRDPEVQALAVSGLREIYNCHAAQLIAGHDTFALQIAMQASRTSNKIAILEPETYQGSWSDLSHALAAGSSARIIQSHVFGEDATLDCVASAVLSREIEQHAPDVLFASHVCARTGALLPEAALREIAQATHTCGGLFILDARMSGSAWLDMDDLGIDVLIPSLHHALAAPSGISTVLTSERATLPLHTVLPPVSKQACGQLSAALISTQATGTDQLEQAQWQIAQSARALLQQKGFNPCVAPTSSAPTTILCNRATSDGAYSWHQFKFLKRSMLEDVAGTLCALETYLEQPADET